jgi:hypothetical protein
MLGLRVLQYHDMLFHFATLAARKVLHAASRSFERGVNHQLQVSME